MTTSKARLAARHRYHPVFFLNPDDGHRRCWVIDLEPSATADTGTVVAECLGKAMAIRMADALNGQPTIPDEDKPTPTPSPATMTVTPGPDQF